MRRFLKLVILLFHLILAVLFVAELPTLPEKRTVANVYVWAGQPSDDDYILSFAAGNPAPNTILAYNALPKKLFIRELMISPNGRWLFGIGRLFDLHPQLVYTKIDQPFTAPLSRHYGFQSVQTPGTFIMFLSTRQDSM